MQHGESTANPSTALESLAAPVFIFSKGPESQQMAQAQEKLSVNVAGSVFVKKISKATANTDRDDDALTKKRARAPDLAEEAQNPKKKPKAKAKAKGKGKSKGGCDDGATETAEDLQADVVMPNTGGHRQRKWLDDLLAAVRKAALFTDKEKINQKFDAYGSTAVGNIIAQAIGVGLRFAFMGSIQINGKTLKEWSKARGSGGRQ